MPSDRVERRRPLAGFSGAVLTLIERQELTVVRKRARSSGQSERLRAQAEKLAMMHGRGIPSPALRDDGWEDGCYWFEMDYIVGESLAHAIISGRDLPWSRLAERLVSALETMSAGTTGELPAVSFETKLGTIVERCGRNEQLAACQTEIHTVAERMMVLDWSGIAGGPGHGDMTLENVLVTADNRLFFIDFDVPDIEAFALDAGKLYQDLYGLWLLRRLALAAPDGVELLNARLRLARIATRFDALLVPRIPGGRVRLARIAAYHLMRTLPYAADSAIPRFVLGRVATLLNVR